jgi:SNF2 family DNA or RNA helicase
MLNKTNLHPYQLEVIKKAKTIPHMGLFMEPGLGKTVTALTIISESPKGKTLIVAPKRVAESVWAQECQKWEHLKQLSIAKVMGTPKQRQTSLESTSSIYVVNLENLVWLLEQNKKFDYLIIDESSRFKDPSTKRFKALKKHLKSFKRRLILTGTPSPQGLQDLWSQVGILDLGERLETSLTKFRDKYMDPGQKNRYTGVVYNYVPKQTSSLIIYKKINDICLSLKAEDYLQLPTLTKLYQTIEIDDTTRKQYDELRKDMVLTTDTGHITAPTAAALAGKLLQFTSGAVYTEGGETQEVHRAKLERLESIMEESSSPTLVFYHFKHSFQRIRQMFPEAVVLDDDNIEAWRCGKIRMLLAHPQSGGIGINLQCNVGETAQTVWFDLPWSSENYIQANARIYRQGQEKPVIIHHLMVSKTIDTRVIDVLEGKINLQDALMEDLKFALI